MINPVLGDSSRSGTSVSSRSIHHSSISDDDSIDTCDRWIDIDVTSCVCCGVLSCDEDESLVCTRVVNVCIDLDITSFDDDSF